MLHRSENLVILLLQKYGELSYKEAGTDFTKAFNYERLKRGLPIIPDNWYNVRPLYYKVQLWENPDTLTPRYAEKTVVAGLKAQIESEEDRYEIRKTDNISYQVVFDYNYLDSSLVCTLRNTRGPEPSGVRWAGDIISVLTLGQALDTLKAHGLTRDKLKLE